MEIEGLFYTLSGKQKSVFTVTPHRPHYPLRTFLEGEKKTIKVGEIFYFIDICSVASSNFKRTSPEGTDPQWNLGKEPTGLIEKRIPVGILSQKKGKTTSSLFKSQFHEETTRDIKTMQ